MHHICLIASAPSRAYYYTVSALARRAGGTCSIRSLFRSNSVHYLGCHRLVSSNVDLPHWVHITTGGREFGSDFTFGSAPSAPICYAPSPLRRIRHHHHHHHIHSHVFSSHLSAFFAVPHFRFCQHFDTARCTVELA